MSDYGTPPPPPNDDVNRPGGMPSMPDYQGTAPAVTATRPPAMDQAVMLMKVGAVLSLIGLLLSLFMRDSIRQSVEKAAQKNGGMTPAQIDTAVSVGTATGVIFGLIGVGLWLWMASANGKGKSWARIVATVFFAISVLSFVISLVQAQPTVTRLLSIVTVLLGAYIIFLLYKKESSAYYQAQSAPRV